METIRLSLKGNRISCCFAAMILSMNGVRYLLNIQESNIIIYGLYALFIVGAFFTYHSRITKLNQISIVILLATFFSLCAFVTSLFGSTSDLLKGVKVVLILLVSLSLYIMDLKGFRTTINIFYIITSIYIAVVLLRPERIAVYLRQGSNYLVLTLPIGLLLTMMLTRIMYQVYSKVEIKTLILDILTSILSFICLTKFTGRGSMIFPFLVAIIFAIVLGGKHVLKKMAILLVIIVAIYVGFQFFIKYGNEYAVTRMLRLFTNRSNEDRWKIWSDYIEYVLSDGRWILGSGTGSSVRNLGFYPHNIYLQCVGEFGILGLIFSVYTTVSAIRVQLKAIKAFSLSTKESLLFVEFSGGLAYLFMNFMKSFQIYDAVLLFMFTMGVISIYYQMKRERKIWQV